MGAFYFILRIGFVQSLKLIQIWFEFKMICKLDNSLENRKGFNPENWHWAETPLPAQPSLPLLLSRAAQEQSKPNRHLTHTR
jgi:hypothetical protein